MEAIEQGIAKDGDEMPNSNMWISQLFLWGMSSAWTDRMQSHFEYKYLVSQLSIQGLHLKVLQLALLDGSSKHVAKLTTWHRNTNHYVPVWCHWLFHHTPEIIARIFRNCPLIVSFKPIAVVNGLERKIWQVIRCWWQFISNSDYQTKGAMVVLVAVISRSVWTNKLDMSCCSADVSDADMGSSMTIISKSRNCRNFGSTWNCATPRWIQV